MSMSRQDLLGQIAAANSTPPEPTTSPDATDGSSGKARAATARLKSTSSELPIWFYNARYPNEKFVDPKDKNRDAPRSFKFARGQFIAKEPWQVEILRRKPHVFEADFDEDLDPCEVCGYTTRSLRDQQAHMRSHL